MMLMEEAEETSVSEPTTAQLAATEPSPLLAAAAAAPSPARTAAAAVNLYKHRQAIVDTIPARLNILNLSTTAIVEKHTEKDATEKIEQTWLEGERERIAGEREIEMIDTKTIKDTTVAAAAATTGTAVAVAAAATTTGTTTAVAAAAATTKEDRQHVYQI